MSELEQTKPLDEAKREATLQATIKLLTLLCVFQEKLILAATAREPLKVLFFSWISLKQYMQPNTWSQDSVLRRSHAASGSAVQTVEHAVIELYEAQCVLLLELLCDDTYSIGEAA